MHNHASYNVRGFSQGFYRRGQDSADLLLYEQSSHNIVAFNSMTHGGDGLFLWAGQSTMDTGQGGANDNLFYANDFSYAPTNAMDPAKGSAVKRRHNMCLDLSIDCASRESLRDRFFCGIGGLA